MTVASLAMLLIQQTKKEIYDYALGVAQALDLPVTSWQPGDPTRSLFHLESELLSRLEAVVAGYIGSGFLHYATIDGWLEVCAKEFFNVDVPDATAASTEVVLTNAGGGLYDGIEPGDLTFKCSLTQKTYTNTTGGDLASGPGTTLTVTVVADEPGSDSSAGAGEIDELVTVLLGVTCTNPTAAIGIDKWDRSTIIQQCLDKLGSLSPDGPKEAYSYVARNRDLTGTSSVTRVRTYPDSDTGDIVVYLAGPSGAISSPDRDLVEAAILKWALPLCITPTVLSATAVPIAVTYELWVYKSVNKTVEEIEDDVESALEALFASDKLSPIGGNIIPPATTGKIYKSAIEAAIEAVYPEIFRVSLSAPAADTTLANSEVAALGAVTATIHLVVDP